MIINTHQQLEENRKALQTLIDEGMTTSEEFVRRSNVIVQINFTRMVTISYATLRKDDFFGCVEKLASEHLLVLYRRYDQWTRVELMTDLSDAELHKHFDAFAEGTLCIAERCRYD
jgi:hypothetical protein